MDRIRLDVRAINDAVGRGEPAEVMKNALLSRIIELEAFGNHYLLKENVLFPYLEKVWPEHRCLSLWT